MKMQKRLSLHDLERLRREARRLKKTSGVPLHTALDSIANRESFPNWSLLAKAAKATVVLQSASAKSRFTGLTDAEVAEVLADWFRAHHTEAVDESPYDSAEGGYLWPTLELGDIEPILAGEFPEASEEAVVLAAEELDSEGPWMDPEFMRKLNDEV